VLADNVWSSRQNYRPCVMVYRFCQATQPRPQKSFVWHRLKDYMHGTRAKCVIINV